MRGRASSRWRTLAAGAAIAAALGACADVASTPMQQGPWRPVPPGAMSLGVANSTTLTVSLVVNGAIVRTLEPGAAVAVIPAAALPPLPWVASMRSLSGRVLATMTVSAGDVIQEPGLAPGVNLTKGKAVRVDLACGRLELWTGPSSDGPTLGPNSRETVACEP